MTSSSYYTYGPSSDQNNNDQSEGTENKRIGVGVEQVQLEGIVQESYDQEQDSESIYQEAENGDA